MEDHEHDTCTHSHEHTHPGDAGPHTHSHTHEHGHEHEHAHSHDMPGDKIIALLQYMLDHNIHHAAELNDIAQQISGEARHQLLHAVESFDQANGYLSAALELLKNNTKEGAI